MVNNDSSNILCFYTFSFWYFLDPVLRAGFSIIGQNRGFVIVPKRKIQKMKNVTSVYYLTCVMPPKIFQSFFACFWSFLPYFTWIFFNCAKISQSPISGTPQILIGLVNNTKKWCQKSCNILWHLNFLLRRCVTCSYFISLGFFHIITAHIRRSFKIISARKDVK